MAIYHLSIKIISRGKGKSAVAAAAYRSGEKIKNEYDGVIHDYTRKSGITHTEILLPDNAPTEYTERATLWNAVEKIEKAKNSQLAREIELALPKELLEEQNIALVKAYCQKYFVSVGMCADICIHDKGDGNPHAHIMLTMRPFEQDGNWGAKSKKEYILDENGERIILPSGEFKSRKVNATYWNEQTKAEEWRSGWADMVNQFLQNQNIPERVDHRSFERQGVELIPSIHLGVVANQMEKRGIQTERGNINREIEVTNQQLRQLKARIKKLQEWISEEELNTAPPTLADIVSEILEKKERHTLTNLKEGAKIYNFLIENNISDLKDLEKKLSDMIGKQFAVSDKLKPINRRLETLDEHFRHSENYKKYRGHKAQYDKLHSEYKALKNSAGFGVKRKTQKALDTFNEYAETHRSELTLYKNAEQYLKDVLQSHFDPKKSPPIKKWKSEQAELLAQKDALNNEYKKLKTETREVEIIRREVEQIVRSDRPKQKSKGYDMEL